MGLNKFLEFCVSTSGHLHVHVYSGYMMTGKAIWFDASHRSPRDIYRSHIADDEFNAVVTQTFKARD